MRLQDQAYACCACSQPVRQWSTLPDCSTDLNAHCGRMGASSMPPLASIVPQAPVLVPVQAAALPHALHNPM
jgi:hypothetical protein